MAYARVLRESFPYLDPRVEDLFLLEAHQIDGLSERAPRRELATVLNAHPELFRFFTARHPPSEPYLADLMARHSTEPGTELAEAEETLLWEIGDWILYQRMPERYDEAASFEPGLEAVLDVAPIAGKLVVDAGAGVGAVGFALAPVAKYVLAVEPVARLRSYMRAKAKRLGVDNLFVMDGFLSDLPMPPMWVDVVVTRQAIGWRLEDELREVDRVLKPSGAAVHLLGLPAPAPSGDELHHALTAAGYQPGTYREGGQDRRKYWKHEPS